MFNGIIQETGKIQVIKLDNKCFIKLKTKLNLKKYKVGSSICCDGICLTITNIFKTKSNYFFTVDISQETIDKTTVKFWKKNEIINLEKSLVLQQDISGHFVYGHIDCITKLLKIKKIKNSWNFYFKQLTKNNRKFIVNKGSIAINGISLTVAKVFDDKFSIAIIPQTYKNTNLSNLKINDKVNIEFDMFARYFFNK